MVWTHPPGLDSDSPQCCPSASLPWFPDPSLLYIHHICVPGSTHVLCCLMGTENSSCDQQLLVSWTGNVKQALMFGFPSGPLDTTLCDGFFVERWYFKGVWETLQQSHLTSSSSSWGNTGSFHTHMHKTHLTPQIFFLIFIHSFVNTGKDVV